MTDARNSYNLRTARERVAAELGVDPRNLDYEGRISYNRALAAFILSYPAGFNAATLATAARVAGASYPALQDTSFDWGEFAETAAGNAPAVLGGFTNKLLLVLAVAAVAWVLVNGRTPSGPAPVSA